MELDFKTNFSENKRGKVAAACDLIEALKDLNLPGIAAAFKNMESSASDKSPAVPELALLNPSLATLTEKIARQASFSLSIVPFSVKAGWEIEF